MLLSAPFSHLISIKLNSSNVGGQDETLVIFDDNGTPAGDLFQSNFDSPKLFSPGSPNIYSFHESNPNSFISINIQGQFVYDRIIPIGISFNSAAGNCVLTANNFPDYTGTSQILLQDLLLNTTHDFRADTTYEFVNNITGQVNNRFRLILRPKATIQPVNGSCNDDNTSFNISNFSSIPVNIFIYDLNNVALYSTTNFTGTENVPFGVGDYFAVINNTTQIDTLFFSILLENDLINGEFIINNDTLFLNDGALFTGMFNYSGPTDSVVWEIENLFQVSSAPNQQISYNFSQTGIYNVIATSYYLGCEFSQIFTIYVEEQVSPFVDVTFTLILPQPISPNGIVTIFGDFNNYNLFSTPMEHIGETMYKITLTLQRDTTVNYRYAIQDPDPLVEVLDGECGIFVGGFFNSWFRQAFIPNNNIELPFDCFTQCISTCSLPTASVNLKVNMANESNVSDVFVMGSFNDFNSNGTLLNNTSANIFEVTVNVPFGSTILYRFVNLSESEIVPQSCGVEFEQSYFRQIDVNSFAIEANVVCFNECEDCLTTSIKSNSPSNFIIFPNPAQDLITISANKNIGNIIFTDLTGKEVINFDVINAQSIDISTSHLSPGVYLVRHQGTNGIPIKFIKTAN